MRESCVGVAVQLADKLAAVLMKPLTRRVRQRDSANDAVLRRRESGDLRVPLAVDENRSGLEVDAVPPQSLHRRRRAGMLRTTAASARRRAERTVRYPPVLHRQRASAVVALPRVALRHRRQTDHPGGWACRRERPNMSPDPPSQRFSPRTDLPLRDLFGPRSRRHRPLRQKRRPPKGPPTVPTHRDFATLALRTTGERRPGPLRASSVGWLQRFIDERLPPLAEVALAASALAELRHGTRNTGVDTLKRLIQRG